jgi:tetratricopeptide (TPR) repeat protein
MLEDANGNSDDAEKSYRKALEISPGTPIAANNLAWMIADSNRGNLDEALRFAQETVSKNQNVAGFHDTLGWVNYKKGFYLRAVESFKKAIALDERQAKRSGKAVNSGYRLRLGMALASLGDKSSARKEIAIAIRNGGAELSPRDIRDAKNSLGDS